MPAADLPPQALCEARGVTHDFRQPDGRPRRVLEGVDFAIGPEEVVALLGPSGCGKSTLLRILAGLLRPTAGQVLYHGRPLEGLNPGVGMVFQGPALYPWFTVAKNIAIVLEAAGVGRAAIADRVERALERVGLAGFSGAYPRELSGVREDDAAGLIGLRGAVEVSVERLVGVRRRRPRVV
jgi:NitT/TauT family transport system ATP-binding protein